MPGLPRNCVKKALLIGVEYSSTSIWELKGAHKDPQTIQKLLIGASVVPLYSDSAAADGVLQRCTVMTQKTSLFSSTTKHNSMYGPRERTLYVLFRSPVVGASYTFIQLAAMRDLVKGAQPGDHFVFSCQLYYH